MAVFKNLIQISSHSAAPKESNFSWHRPKPLSVVGCLHHVSFEERCVDVLLENSELEIYTNSWNFRKNE